MRIIRRKHTPAKIEYTDCVCARCQQRPRLVHTSESQPYNGLHLVNCYGYGMWRDQMPDGDSVRDILLCERCTDAFLIENPWLERYLSEE